MKLYNLRPILWVNDVRRTIDWYVDTLGFEEAAYVEKWNWGQVLKDGIRIMFGKPHEFTERGQSEFTGSIYFNVDDVEPLWQQLKDSHTLFIIRLKRLNMK